MKACNKIQLLYLLNTFPISFCLLTSSVIETLLTIADSTYNHNQATSIVWYKNLEEIDIFLNKFHGTVVLIPIQNAEAIRKFNKKDGYQQTIFFSSELDELANFMAVLSSVVVVPIRLILVLNKPVTDIEMSALTKTAWKQDLTDIIIVSAHEEKSMLHTFYPYSKGICGNHAPVKIETKEKIWFPNKFSTFKGCPIRVSVIAVPPYSDIVIENDTVKLITGIDGHVLTMVIEKLNASMDIVSWKDHGGIGTYIDGNATGSFGDLVHKRADILAPSILINYLRYPVAQISHVYYTVDVFWFAPHRREIYEWMKVLQPLMTEISFAILTSFILFIVITKIVIRYGHGVYFRQSVAFQSFTMFLGQEVKFESSSWLLNCLFAVWIWFCMIVRIVYQGDLVNGLQKIILEKPLRNLKEAVKVLDGYGGVEGFREFYRGTRYFDKYEVLKITGIDLQVKKVSDGLSFLIATDKLIAFGMSKGLQIVGEPITHAPTCLFMRPGWPAAKQIDVVIRRLTEAGFVQKMMKDLYHEWMKKEMRHAERKTQALNMKTLIGCFYGLGALYMICSFVFIGELFYNRLAHKSRRKNFKFLSKTQHKN